VACGFVGAAPDPPNLELEQLRDVVPCQYTTAT